MPAAHLLNQRPDWMPTLLARLMCMCFFPTQCWLSGTHRETLARLLADWELQCVQCNCLSEGIVINKTPLPYQLTRMSALLPFGEWGPDATLEMCCMALSLFASDSVGSANVQQALRLPTSRRQYLSSSFTSYNVL